MVYSLLHNATANEKPLCVYVPQPTIDPRGNFNKNVLSVREYELKTINKLLSKSVTTNHHLNLDILAKYRAVKAWYIAVYEGIVLKAIYRVDPTSLETKFSYWESRIRGGMESINNPKIPLSLIEKEGELVYPKPNEQTL
nr:hypothetical protein [Dolichospermum sp. LEGE 00240]